MRKVLKEFNTVFSSCSKINNFLSRTLTSHINFDRMTKTKSSGAMCGFRTKISDLESLDIMCQYSQGMMCRNMFQCVPIWLRPMLIHDAKKKFEICQFFLVKNVKLCILCFGLCELFLPSQKKNPNILQQCNVLPYYLKQTFPPII